MFNTCTRKLKYLYEWVPPKTPWNSSIKICVFIFTYLNFSHLRGALCLMQYTC